MIKLTDILFEGKLSPAQAKKAHKKFKETGELPPHLKKLLKKIKEFEKKNSELSFTVKDVVVPGLEWMADIKEEIVTGGVKSGGSDAGRDVVKAMTANKRLSDLSNMTNWLGQYKDGIEFGLKKKMKVGGEVVSIVQIKVTGKDKFTIAYLDWDNGKRPLLTRKIIKNISGKNLPNELKKSVKVG